MDEALHLFAENGYSNTSLALIAKNCSISKSNIYHHFKNKEALVFSLLDDHTHTLFDLFGVDTEYENAYEQLEQKTLQMVAHVRENTQLHKLFYSLLKQVNAIPSLAQHLDEIRTDYVPAYIQLFERLNLKNPTEEMIYFGSVKEGILIQYFQAGEAYPLELMFKMLLERYR